MTADEAKLTEELSVDACWDLLTKARTGRLAVAIGDQPDIFPINHVVDGRTIVFRTDPGTKLAAAVLGSGVAYEVDHIDDSNGVAECGAEGQGKRTAHGGGDGSRRRSGAVPMGPWR